MIEQTRFLSTVFLCSEFKLENIYSGGNFCRKNVCGNLYLREVFLRIAGKIAKVRTCKKFRATRYITKIKASRRSSLLLLSHNKLSKLIL